jgi:hypothetical protein
MSNWQSAKIDANKIKPQAIIGALLDHVRYCFDREMFATALNDLEQCKLFLPLVSDEHRDTYERYVCKYIDAGTAAYELKRQRDA